MRYEGCVTSLSWIPSEAVTGVPRMAFDAGISHYDDPPPANLDPRAGLLEGLQAADRFRFANVLRAWIEVDAEGQIIDAGYAGSGLMGSTTVKLGSRRFRFQAVQLPDIRRNPEHGDGWARFTQTVGGRTGVPTPRKVRRSPYVQWQAPLAWTTLSLTLHADGRADGALTGASPFPRHWVYDGSGRLSHKSGLTDFSNWYTTCFGPHTPWGDEDSPALVTTVETALERSLSVYLMQGARRPQIRNEPAGVVVVRQGDPGTDIYLVLDGIIRVDRDGEPLAEYGPGALLGERAHLEGGTRTSSLVTITPCRLAFVPATQFNRSALVELSGGHRREEAAPADLRGRPAAPITMPAPRTGYSSHDIGRRRDRGRLGAERARSSPHHGQGGAGRPGHRRSRHSRRGLPH